MTFDASKHLTKLSGRDYLEVKWRLVWLRAEHPDAEILTTLLEHDAAEGMAVVSACVTLPGKGFATGLGSETRRDFKDYLEKAETKAIGRALGALGFGTQFCDDFDFAEGSKGSDIKVVDSPVQRTAPTPPQGQPIQRMPQPQAQQTPANGTGEMVSEPQLKKIWAMWQTFGWSKEEGLEHCANGYGGRGPRQLTKREASGYIDGMTQLASNAAGGQ